MVTDEWPDLTRTAAAVDAYDAARAAYTGASSHDGALFAEMARADRAVRESFAADTADRNDRETALMVAPRDPWLRRLIATWRGRPSVPACAP